MKNYVFPFNPWILGPLCTLLFGVVGAYLLWEGLDPVWPAQKVRPFMIVLSAGSVLVSLSAAVFTVRARMWPRVVLNHVRILIVEDRHWRSVRFADIRAARWVPGLKLGRLELVTESDGCRVE